MCRYKPENVTHLSYRWVSLLVNLVRKLFCVGTSSIIVLIYILVNLLIVNQTRCNTGLCNHVSPDVCGLHVGEECKHGSEGSGVVLYSYRSDWQNAHAQDHSWNLRAVDCVLGYVSTSLFFLWLSLEGCEIADRNQTVHKRWMYQKLKQWEMIQYNLMLHRVNGLLLIFKCVLIALHTVGQRLLRAQI